MDHVRLAEQRGKVARLQAELEGERTRLQEMEQRRQRFHDLTHPYLERARAAVSEAIPELQEWRQDFAQAVKGFETEKVGELGRRLAEIEGKLYPVLEEAAGKAYHEKRRELGIGSSYEERLDALAPCDAAARQAVEDVGGKDPRLTVFQDIRSEVGKRFAQMILEYLQDRGVKLYSPKTGAKHFLKR